MDAVRNKLKNPLSLGDILKTALKQPVIGPPPVPAGDRPRPPTAKENHDPVVLFLKAKWTELVGAKLAAKSRPVATFAKKLVVEVPSSAWANELEFLKTAILEKIRVYPQTRHVDDVRFQVETRSPDNGLKTKPLKSFG